MSIFSSSKAIMTHEQTLKLITVVGYLITHVAYKDDPTAVKMNEIMREIFRDVVSASNLPEVMRDKFAEIDERYDDKIEYHG